MSDLTLLNGTVAEINQWGSGLKLLGQQNWYSYSLDKYRGQPFEVAVQGDTVTLGVSIGQNGKTYVGTLKVQNRVAEKWAPDTAPQSLPQQPAEVPFQQSPDEQYAQPEDPGPVPPLIDPSGLEYPSPPSVMDVPRDVQLDIRRAVWLKAATRIVAALAPIPMMQIATPDDAKNLVIIIADQYEEHYEGK